MHKFQINVFNSRPILLTCQLFKVSFFLQLEDLLADDLGQVAALLNGDGQRLLGERLAHLREVAVLESIL
jgi:hypothetical protein